MEIHLANRWDFAFVKLCSISCNCLSLSNMKVLQTKTHKLHTNLVGMSINIRGKPMRNFLVYLEGTFHTEMWPPKCFGHVSSC
jgi:hypothetical protein